LPFPDASSFENNTRWADQIPPATEAEEYALWRTRLATAVIAAGPPS